MYDGNEYEEAFESWLRESGIRHVGVDQHKRAAFARHKIKSFDLVVYPRSEGGEVAIVEVKGRLFRGRNLRKNSGQNWVTMEDVRGLKTWELAFGEGHRGVFVFARRLENIDVELDGRTAYDFRGGRYVFDCVMLGDYVERMTIRSPRWETVYLAAGDFREIVESAEDFFR